MAKSINETASRTMIFIPFTLRRGGALGELKESLDCAIVARSSSVLIIWP